MKDFKVAQIVPVSCLHMIQGNHYHMCLAHLVEASDEYTKFYRGMSEHGKYVLMDNGAAENSQLGVDELLAMYDKVKPTEIVVPDTLCDMEDTLKKMDSFVSEYGGIYWSNDEKGWGYGVAPKSREEFLSRYEGLTTALLDSPDLMGFCYTQLTDVEQEQNGLYTYDRRPKFPPEAIAAVNRRKAAIED